MEQCSYVILCALHSHTSLYRNNEKKEEKNRKKTRCVFIEPDLQKRYIRYIICNMKLKTLLCLLYHSSWMHFCFLLLLLLIPTVLVHIIFICSYFWYQWNEIRKQWIQSNLMSVCWLFLSLELDEYWRYVFHSIKWRKKFVWHDWLYKCN